MPLPSSRSSDLSSSLLPATPPPTTKSEDAAIRQRDGLSLALEKRVLDASGSGNKCIITNTRDSDNGYTHILSRSIAEHIITRLEYSWGMKYGQLNVDSSSNILRLSSDLHKSFQRSLWILIPEDRAIISTYRKRRKKRGLASDSGDAFAELSPVGPPYRYNFIASRYFKRTTLERLLESPPDTPLLDGCNNYDSERHIQRYSYPFPDFPTIISHVHPRFVIYHAGRALLKNQYSFLIARPELQSIVPRLISIYKAWTRPIPPADINAFVRVSLSKPLDAGDHGDVEGHDPEEDRSDTSCVTRAERFNWRINLKGRLNTAISDPPPPDILDRGTLLVLNALNPHDDTPKTKTESISRWLAQVPTQAGPNEFDIDPRSDIPLT